MPAHATILRDVRNPA